MNTKDFSSIWLMAINAILESGTRVSPRGNGTLEVPQATMVVDMRYPVLTVESRGLSYQFMAAEAYWILSGDDTVEGIEPWNKHIAKFSDDGKTFFGAYGPPIQNQIGWVVNKLNEDQDTRQAGLTIWRQKPHKTKDVPCTVAIFFSIRNGKLNSHVFMRSSDIWLGLPYDVFNFSMLSHDVCCLLNETRSGDDLVSPGGLYLTAASMHLYDRDQSQARECLSSVVRPINETPVGLYTDRSNLYWTLKNLRDSKPGEDLRWWE